jgi:TonB-dependent receptor
MDRHSDSEVDVNAFETDRQVAICRKIIATVCLLLPVLLFGQRVTVRVADAGTGAGIAGALITLEKDGRRATADPSGWIQMELGSAGVYEGLVSADGYGTRLIRIELQPDMPILMVEAMLTPQVYDLGSFTVQAQLNDEDRDIIAAREAVAPTSQVSGDELRDITSDGVGESLEKIAGVTTSSEDGAIGGISIRGAGARQTRVTLDGQSMAGGGGRGATRGAGAMNRVPREFLDRVQVMKAPTPDMDADAIGGTVDLQTSRVANAKTPRSSFSLRSAVQEIDSVWSHRINLTHAQPVRLAHSQRRLGFLIGVSGQTADATGDELRVLNQWPLRNSPDLGEPVRLLARLRTTARATERWGHGAMLNADFEFSPESRLQFKALFDRSGSDQLMEFFTHDFGRGRVLSLQPEAASFEGMLLEKQFIARRDRNRSGTVVLGADQRVGQWQFEETIGFSFADSQSPAAQNATFQTRRIFDGSYALAEAPEAPQVELQLEGVPQTPGDLVDPGLYPFVRYELTDSDASDKETAIRFNAGRRWDSASAQWMFKSGLKARLREAEQNQEKSRFTPGSIPFTVADVAARGPFTAFNERYPIGPSWDPAAMVALFSTRPDAFSFDVLNSTIDSLASDFSVEEEIYSAYAMFQRETEKWVLIAGLRLEHAQYTAGGYETITARSENGDRSLEVLPVTIASRDSKWFPGLHALHRFSPNWVARLSLTRTLQRPDFRDLSPSSRVNLDTKRIRSGNPHLRPFDAKAVDLGTDFVLGSWGSVSLGIFYKRIDDFIVDVEEVTDYLGEPGYTRSRPINGSPADLLGVEAAWNVEFGFLPFPFDTTALSLNYTYTDSTAAYPGFVETTILLPEQVRDVFNANVRWRLGNWQVSLRMRYTGMRLDRLIIPGQDQYTGGLWSQSVSVNYKLSDSASLAIGLMNLSQPNRVSYQGQPSQLVANRQGSRAFSIGLNVRFSNGLAVRRNVL